MASENEPAKLLLPYLQRADELHKHESLVAYYCRLYAMERGLKIPQNERTKTTNSLLISLMKQVEKMQVQSFLFWFDVDEIRVDFPSSDNIYFTVGIINKKLDEEERLTGFHASGRGKSGTPFMMRMKTGSTKSMKRKGVDAEATEPFSRKANRYIIAIEF